MDSEQGEMKNSEQTRGGRCVTGESQNGRETNQEGSNPSKVVKAEAAGFRQQGKASFLSTTVGSTLSSKHGEHAQSERVGGKIAGECVGGGGSREELEWATCSKSLEVTSRRES